MLITSFVQGHVGYPRSVRKRGKEKWQRELDRFKLQQWDWDQVTAIERKMAKNRENTGTQSLIFFEPLSGNGRSYCTTGGSALEFLRAKTAMLNHLKATQDTVALVNITDLYDRFSESSDQCVTREISQLLLALQPFISEEQLEVVRSKFDAGLVTNAAQGADLRQHPLSVLLQRALGTYAPLGIMNMFEGAFENEDDDALSMGRDGGESESEGSEFSMHLGGGGVAESKGDGGESEMSNSSF